jgi:nucleoside-diphosphate-sugar epimerase
MKILVTGYKGFIGQNMVQYLHDNTDWEVSTPDSVEDNYRVLPGDSQK